MNLFNKAFEFLMDHEGVYSNDENDPGGETNYGISSAFAQTIGITDVKNITKSKAKEIYKTEFWQQGGYEFLSNTSSLLAVKLFDMGVNVGCTRANIIFQKLLNALLPLLVEENNDPLLKVDGIIGTKTAKRLAESNLYGASDCYIFNCLCIEFHENYLDLCRANKNLDKFLPGWHRRAYDIPLLKC